MGGDPAQRGSQGGADAWDRRWYVRVGDKPYGPYTGHQMRAYIAEGRIVASSPLVEEGGTTWRPAGGEQLFGALFAEAQDIARSAQPAPTPVRHVENRAPGVSNFVIAIDMRSRPSTKLEQAIMELGPACRIIGSVWALSGAYTVSGLRNQLVQYFGTSDSFFIVDATNGKTAWYNLGPEADARIRRVWDNVVKR